MHRYKICSHINFVRKMSISTMTKTCSNTHLNNPVDCSRTGQSKHTAKFFHRLTQRWVVVSNKLAIARLRFSHLFTISLQENSS